MTQTKSTYELVSSLAGQYRPPVQSVPVGAIGCQRYYDGQVLSLTTYPRYVQVSELRECCRLGKRTKVGLEIFSVTLVFLPATCGPQMNIDLFGVNKHWLWLTDAVQVHLKQSSYKLRLMGEAHTSNHALQDKRFSPTWTVDDSRGIVQVLQHNCRNVFSPTRHHCRKGAGQPSHTARSKKETSLASDHHFVLWLGAIEVSYSHYTVICAVEVRGGISQHRCAETGKEGNQSFTEPDKPETLSEHREMATDDVKGPVHQVVSDDGLQIWDLANFNKIGFYHTTAWINTARVF